ncbi:MAG TPA: energy transducer TonB [Rhizomicrobium sp.]
MRAILTRFIPILLVSMATPSLAGPTTNPAPPTPASASQSSAPVALGGQYCAAFYPPIAVRLNQQGSVGIAVEVSAQGTVTNVRIVQSSGYDALDLAAIRCAMQWTYRPAIRNGVTTASRTEATIAFSLGGAGPISAPVRVPSPPLWTPPPPPPGWERDRSSENQAGVVAAYELSAPTPASDQYLSAGVYSNASSLDDFVAQHESELRGLSGSGSFREQTIAVCGGVPAWEAEYSRAGLNRSAPKAALTIRQVATVRNGDAYVATYIRPAGASVRPDADEWIRAYCRANG